MVGLAEAAVAATLAFGACPVGAEDDPGWNWVKCGGHERGVVTTAGTFRVVRPCKFQWLVTTGRVTFPPNERIRGDKTAMRRNCS